MISQYRTVTAQQVPFKAFMERAVLTPLINHGRVASVLFDGEDCGFVDALGEEGLRQAHRSAVNNALYINSPGAPDFMVSTLPSAEALDEYPDLELLFPLAAKKVRHPGALEDAQMHGDTEGGTISTGREGESLAVGTGAPLD